MNKPVNTVLFNSVVASTKCLEKSSLLGQVLGTREEGSKTISNGQPYASYSWQLGTEGLNCTTNKTLL